MIYIDAHNYLKRIYHGGGNPYSLFYEMLSKYSAEAVEVICDGSNSRKYRKDIHPGYKAGRDQGDDPIYWELYNNCMKLALEFPNTFVVRMTAGEADDYIMDKAKQLDKVISNDKDLWSLLDKGVDILLNASTKVDAQLVEVKFGCTTRHIQLYKTLVGDPSDKIPGKRGFGAKAWEKLSIEDRDFYNEHFIKGISTSETEDLMTESACMSWKLAAPWKDYTADVIGGKPNGNPMKLINDLGVIL